MSEWKPTNNPKDALGTVKAPVHLVPASLEIATSMAFLEGREKYGQFNWRITGVRANVYYSALMRHMKAWWDGEDIDPDSGLPHLWKVAACVAILIDATELGVLEDDRPPKAPTAELMARTKELGEAIRKRLEDYNPYQYTEKNRAEGPQEDPGPAQRGVAEKTVYQPLPCPECGRSSTFVDRVTGTERDVTYRCPDHKEFNVSLADEASSGDLSARG